MKKIFFCLTLLLLVFTACKKMDDMYREYCVPGGDIYVGKANSPLAYVGHNRVKISWLRGADPTIVKARIFWNYYADSVEVNIPSSGDTISVIIDNLPEKAYSFIIKTYDSAGNSSVQVEVLSAVYGEKYQASLLYRPIKSSIMEVNGIVTTQWGDADISNGAYATEVNYTNTLGAIIKQRIGVNQSSSIISDYKPGTTYQFRTVYLPDSLSIDTFYTDFKDQNVSTKIDKSTWTATADSYEPQRLLPSGPPKQAIDDNINTYWQVAYPSTIPYPHWLAVDMHQVINVSNVELTCRQSVFTGFNSFRIDGSLDGTNWITYGSFAFLQINATQRFPITNIPKMRYIRVYAEKGVNTTYAFLAEFSVYGY